MGATSKEPFKYCMSHFTLTCTFCYCGQSQTGCILLFPVFMLRWANQQLIQIKYDRGSMASTYLTFSKKPNFPKCETFKNNTCIAHLSITGIPKGISRYSHWVFRPWVWDQYFSCSRISGSKDHWASRNLGQDVERKWPRCLTGVLWASWAGSFHSTGGESAWERPQEDVTLWEAMPW